MGRTELGRILDPEALASSDGARGLFRVSVPASWAASGSVIALTLPARVECARCSGGGCDGCGRSGALRIPLEPAARSLRLTIPAGSTEGVALRVARPFDDAVPIEQLIVEVRCGDAASSGVSRVSRRRRGRASRGEALLKPKGRSVWSLAVAVAVVLAAVAGIVATR